MAPALAQTSGTGALTGTVSDPSGAVVPGATVTATNLGTRQSRTVTTDATGNYNFSLLPTGLYRVMFSAKGFKTVEVRSVVVSVTETPVLDQSLSVGAESEQIIVSSAAEKVQTQNATIGRLVGSKAVTDLPLSTRNYTQIVALSPGVVANVASAAAIGNGTQDVNVNGSGADQNNYMMDGASITNYGSGGAAQSGNFPGIGIPNPDSIQEFKVQTSQYDAAYGQNPGANVNVVTKGGTNDFHGAAWEFNRNNFFNADDFFLKRSQAADGLPQAPPALKQNQFGGTLGGPIKKDKLFFFGSYQGTRQINGVGSNGFVSGHTAVGLLPFNEPGFSGTDARANHAGLTVPLNLVPGNAACDASTYRRYLGCAFGDEVDALGFLGIGTGVPVAEDGSNINQVAINVLQARDARATGPYNQGFYAPSLLYGGSGPACLRPGSTIDCAAPTTIVDPIRAKEDQFIANADYVISNKHTLAERFMYANDPQVQTLVCIVGCAPGAPANFATYTTANALLKVTSVLTSNFVNEARVSYQRELASGRNGITLKACDVGIIPMVNNGGACPGVSRDAIDTLQLIPVIASLGFPDHFEGGFPANTWGGGGFQLGGIGFTAATNYFNTYQYADQISWNHGKNSLRAGLEAQRIQWNSTSTDPGRGVIVFGNIADFFTSGSGAPNTTPTNVQNGVVLNATSRLPPDGTNYRALRVNDFSAFAQDDIKVSRHLSLNIGLRWEYDGFPSNRTGLFTNFWATQAVLVNTGSYFLNSPIGTLAGYVVPSNYNANSTICGTPCGYAAPNGATGVYTNTNKTLMHGSPIANFAPRLGFAWQPTSGGRFVIRAGYGIFYDRVYGNLLADNQQSNPPYGGAVGTRPDQTLDNPDTPGALGWVPRTLVVAAGSAASGATLILDRTGGAGLTGNATSDSEFIGTPLIQQYNLDLQYEFAPGWVADLGYVGTHGTHLYNWARDVNIARLVDGAPNEPTDATNLAMVRPAESFAFNDPSNTDPGTRVSMNVQGPGGLPGNSLGRVAILGLGPGGGNTTGTVGDHLYNSLQAQLRHQFSHGLFLQVSYTWSKLITNINLPVALGGIEQPGNVLSGGSASNDPNNLAQQYGLAAFNRPQRLVISYSYDLPYQHTKGFSGKVLSGWTVSGVTTIQDGEPFTVVDSTGGSIYYGGAVGALFGIASVRANLASPGKCNALGNCQSAVPLATSGSAKCRLGIALAGCAANPGWINGSAFTAPVCIGGTVDGDCFGSGGGTGLGNSGIGTVMGPGQFNWDISIIKNTKITESTSLQFRAEFYDAFNHAQFNPPNNDLNAVGAFGLVTSTSVPPRVLQFGLKILF